MHLDKADRMEARRTARDIWCRSRRLGDFTAVFYPGDELRCPGPMPNRQPCGTSLNEYVKPRCQVIVRVRSQYAPVLPHAGTDMQCHSCRALLEKFPILERTG